MSKNREAKEVHCRPAFVWIAIWLVACTVAGGTEAMAKPVIRSVELRPADPGRYDTVELLLDLEARYANPYDPDDVDVQAAFRAPSGRVLRVIGFYYIDHLRSRDLGGAAVRTRQPPTWRVRFTPDEARAPG